MPRPRIRALLIVCATIAARGAFASPSEELVALAREFAAAAAGGDDVKTVELGRRFVALAPDTPGARLKLAAALLRTGDAPDAVLELDAAARMGGAASDAELAPFAGGRFRDLRDRLRANRAPKIRSQEAFQIEERDLFPESAAFDPADGSWYVGSLRKRKIVRRGTDGAVADWIESGRYGLGAVLGVKVDAERHELWAASCNEPDASPEIDPPDESTVGRGALYRFHLPDGELIAAYGAGDRDSPVCFNDLAIAGDGTVYATGTGGVWRWVPGAERIELWHADAGLLNGIAVSADGTRLYVADELQGIVRVDPATGAGTRLRHPTTTTLAGVDGLYLAGDTLVAIQNGFAGGPERVLQAFLTPDGSVARCVSQLERNHPRYSAPTTGAILGNELVYIATSQLDRVGADRRPPPVGELVPNLFLRLPLASSCVPELPPPAPTQLDPCAVKSDAEEPDAVDAMRRRLAETSCAAALWFDGLFGEQQQIGAARSTSGRVELAALGSQFDGLKLRTRVHVRMTFPNLEHRLDAFLGRDESDDFLRDRNEGLALRSQFSRDLDQQDWVAGLGYSLPGSLRARADFRVGASGSRKPEIFAQGRYRRNDELGQNWLLRFRETVFWTNRDGFGTTTSADLDRQLGATLLFRFGNTGTWSEVTDGVDWRSALILYQNLHARRAIAWEAFVRGDSSAEVALKEYGARADYRQPLFGSRWLFGDLVAGYSWPREELATPREGSATLGVGVELLFGRE